jgi:hypothetical protein
MMPVKKGEIGAQIGRPSAWVKRYDSKARLLALML